MQIGIGLPSTIPGTEGQEVVRWARRAEERGFSSLGVIDRIVYDNYEPFIALAGAAAVTERIRLATTILLAPSRGSAALVAKQAASLDRLSGGRLTLGMAVGGRPDDYEAAGVPMADRGARFDAMLEEMERVWAGESRGTAGAIGPRLAKGGPEVIIGGATDASFRRAAQYGSGWIAAGGDPQGFAELADRVKAEWARQGRDGDPRLMALAYYSLGPRAVEDARGYLSDYYAFAGVTPDMAGGMAMTDPGALSQALDAYAAAGCDEVVLFPCSPELDQVDRLADAALV
ncbi:MAG TPA: LLM class flavin-dependent oxidoreductase [Streptosporangiaceae bacterium]|nr:LLM class flavin-dependent oxidoreductase [Streptosporangiaceae bacterium]